MKQGGELTKNRIYTAIVFLAQTISDTSPKQKTNTYWIIGDLSVLRDHSFTTCGHNTKFGDIYFDYGTLCQDAELRIHRGLRVFLNPHDLQLERGLQLRCKDISISTAYTVLA